MSFRACTWVHLWDSPPPLLFIQTGFKNTCREWAGLRLAAARPWLLPPVCASGRRWERSSAALPALPESRTAHWWAWTGRGGQPGRALIQHRYGTQRSPDPGMSQSGEADYNRVQLRLQPQAPLLSSGRAVEQQEEQEKGWETSRHEEKCFSNRQLGQGRSLDPHLCVFLNPARTMPAMCVSAVVSPRLPVMLPSPPQLVFQALF